MKKITGYILIAIGLIGFLFCKYANPDINPYPLVGQFSSLVIVFIGIVLLVIARAEEKNTTPVVPDKIRALKSTGEKITLAWDNCEFIKNNFQQETTSENPSRVEVLDSMLDDSRNYQHEYINQTVIVYKHDHEGTVEKFTSPIFHMDETNLKYHVMNGDIVLYIDSFDRNNYLFDFVESA